MIHAKPCDSCDPAFSCWANPETCRKQPTMNSHTQPEQTATKPARNVPFAHTPTPWKRAMHATGIELLITRPDGFDESFAVLKGCSWETAGEIVRAVNSHADLVAALEHARALISSRDVVLDRAALKMYDAALALAKGTP